MRKLRQEKINDLLNVVQQVSSKAKLGKGMLSG
jgi:hypothetical protein